MPTSDALAGHPRWMSHEPPESNGQAGTLTSTQIDNDPKSCKRTADTVGIEVGKSSSEATKAGGNADKEPEEDREPPMQQPSGIGGSHSLAPTSKPASATDERLPEADNSNKASVGTQTPENMESLSDSRLRKRRGVANWEVERPTMSKLAETPNWLPPGWRIEERVRESGASAGVKDKYYHDNAGHRFRSKKEVLCFLEARTRGIDKEKSKIDPDANGTLSENPYSHKQSGSSLKGKMSSASKPGFKSMPVKVRWVLTDSAEGLWTPFFGNEKVPESNRQKWDSTLASLILGNGATIF